MQLAPTPEDLEAATEMLRNGGDPRRTFCRAASRLLRADIATLWEVFDDELHLTGSVEAMPEIAPRLAIGPGSAAGHAAADGTRFFARDARLDPDPQVAGHLGLRSILAEPIRTVDRTTGVIAVGWREPVAGLDPLVSGFVSLMAVQASMAIKRADVAEHLEHQALTDPLTGLVNRRGLGRELEREIARAARRGSPLGFAMMDLDNFKAYNDEHGHAAGDRLLTRAAHAWLARIRAPDTLARYGGEEFVILLPDCGAGSTTSLEIVERVRAVTPEEQTASVGLAMWDGHEPAERLAERADAALYAAKDRGRNRALAA